MEAYQPRGQPEIGSASCRSPGWPGTNSTHKLLKKVLLTRLLTVFMNLSAGQPRSNTRPALWLAKMCLRYYIIARLLL